MAKKKRLSETESSELGTTSLLESETTETASLLSESQPSESQTESLTVEPPSESPSPTLPNPQRQASATPQVQAPAKRRGRPPGSKSKASPQAQQAVAQAIPPEVLQATALLYSNLLCAFDLTPELNRDEKAAIVFGLDACAQKYAAQIGEHAPLAILVGAMLAPLVPRYLAKRERDTKDEVRLAA